MKRKQVRLSKIHLSRNGLNLCKITSQVPSSSQMPFVIINEILLKIWYIRASKFPDVFLSFFQFCFLAGMTKVKSRRVGETNFSYYWPFWAVYIIVAVITFCAFVSVSEVTYAAFETLKELTQREDSMSDVQQRTFFSYVRCSVNTFFSMSDMYFTTVYYTFFKITPVFLYPTLFYRQYDTFWKKRIFSPPVWWMWFFEKIISKYALWAFFSPVLFFHVFSVFYKNTTV